MSTKLQSVSRQIAAIRRSAESMHAAATETIAAASAGDTVRQGDIYLVCIESLPDGKPAKTRQLAPGTTQGSRHVAAGKCEVFEPNDRAAVADIVNLLVRGANVPAELIGPLVRCEGPTTIEHPEHGWKVLPAESVWATVYQRAYAEEIRRVQD